MDERSLNPDSEAQNEESVFSDEYKAMINRMISDEDNNEVVYLSYEKIKERFQRIC